MHRLLVQLIILQSVGYVINTFPHREKNNSYIDIISIDKIYQYTVGISLLPKNSIPGNRLQLYGLNSVHVQDLCNVYLSVFSRSPVQSLGHMTPLSVSLHAPRPTCSVSLFCLHLMSKVYCNASRNHQHVETA